MKRVPVVLQLTDTDCGAACLAMILGHHGRAVSLADCRDACVAGRDGTTARSIAESARHFGLEVRSFSLEPAGLRELPLPAILHWNFNHFLVLERWSRRGAVVVDPGGGRRTVTSEELDAGFTGVALTLRPGPDFRPNRGPAAPTLRAYLRPWLRQSGVRGLLTQALLASLLLLAATMAAPLLTKVLVDIVLPESMATLMGPLALAGLVLVAGLFLTDYLRSLLLIYLQGKLNSRMTVGFFAHLLSLPYAFFQRRATGDLLMRVSSNQTLRESFTHQAMSTVLDGVFVTGSLLLLLGLVPVFGAFVLLLGLLQAALFLLVNRPLQTLSQQELAASSDAQSYMVEVLTGVGTLKASGAEDRALQHWTNLFHKHLNVSLRRDHLQAVLESGTLALRTLLPLVVLWVGAGHVLRGTMGLGTVLGLNALAVSFLAPLSSLLATAQKLQLLRAHVDRMVDVMSAEPEQRPTPAPRPTPRLEGTLTLVGAGFRYSPHSPWILRHLNLHVAAGQKVALVGRSGSGKSTLARLLLGLHPPTEGQALIDGRPLATLDLQAMRRQFGVVLQDVFLFSGTIRRNISFNDPTLPLDQVQRAARLADIHLDIARMPMGYETLLAEGGKNVSGGQRQRIGIARALAHQPAVVFLDEATSHLDAVTEQSVDERLAALRMTRIVIAHRLSTVRNADLILVLEDGAVVERGRHQELLAHGGHYAALVAGQGDQLARAAG